MSDFRAALDAFGKERARFAASVSARDWRYFDFQLWQEGVARWTEIQLGLLYPDAEVRTAVNVLEQRSRDQLDHPNLAEDRRKAVYPFGPGEAMLLEARRSSWKRDYATATALNGSFTAALRDCRSGGKSSSFSAQPDLQGSAA